MNGKFGLGLGLLVVALVLGGAWGLLLSRQSSNSQIPLPQVSSTPQIVRTSNVSEAVVSPKVQPEPAVATQPEGVPAVAIWEQKLNELLVSDGEPASKAAGILALIPDAPEEGQVQLAQHLVNMVQDDNYTATGDLLTNTNTPSSVSSVLMDDLLNRNNQLKLPMLLAVARAENHPLRDQAMEMLKVFIQDDKGTNWDEWQMAVEKWLVENP